ncbi:MAG: hypothetical protein IT385_23555 [Deltaproteobacteria bacterium]|nr:hypothetical protein [Deltaproteobacteria bacterium]
MPTPEQVLFGLWSIANEHVALAIVWHILVVALFISVTALGRPRARVLGMALALPLASVSALAWSADNPFNGAVLGLVALSLAALALGGPIAALPPRPRAAPSPEWVAWLGWPILVYGLVYPEFVAVSHPIAWLWSAPVGLLPCPTLATVIGLTLVLSPTARLGRSYALVLAGAGLFYGVFGVARLGVVLDLGLVLGALALAASALVRPSGARPAPRRLPEPPVGARPA